MDERLLEEIGLTRGEVKVYVTLLRSGETTTGKIIEGAQISSGKIYTILDKLIRKGLASYIVKNRTKYFSAASPNRILDYLHEKEKSLKEKEEDFREELPSLLAIERTTEKKCEVNLFRGLRGMQSAIFEALEDMTKKDEILAMGIISSKKKQYNILWAKWHKKRITKKIICRAIFSDRATDYFRTFTRMGYTKVKVLRGITPSAIDVMGGRVLIFTYGEEPSCLSIKNPEIAQSFRTFFETLWNAAKK